MPQGTYIGPIEELKGKTAILVEFRSKGCVGAQFDDLSLGMELTHAWPEYDAKDWEINKR